MCDGVVCLIVGFVAGNLYIIGFIGIYINALIRKGRTSVFCYSGRSVKDRIEEIKVEDIPSLPFIKQSRKFYSFIPEGRSQITGPVGLNIANRTGFTRDDGQAIVTDKQLSSLISFIPGAPDDPIPTFCRLNTDLWSGEAAQEDSFYTLR